MEHTKGEWGYIKHGNNDSFGVYTYDGDGRDLAIIVGGNEEGGEAEANAKLISSAPELLEACKELIALLRFHGYTHATEIQQAEDAIRKATI